MNPVNAAACVTILAASLSCASGPAAAECISFTEARNYIGTNQCIRGTVVRVKKGSRNLTFLDFCADYRNCPFTALIVPGDRKRLGDLRRLKGRTIELTGVLEEHAGRAEIVVRHREQLGKDAILGPALPKDYDVEQAGSFGRRSIRRSKQGPKQAP
jgi:hypothetical protein